MGLGLNLCCDCDDEEPYYCGVILEVTTLCPGDVEIFGPFLEGYICGPMVGLTRTCIVNLSRRTTTLVVITTGGEETEFEQRQGYETVDVTCAEEGEDAAVYQVGPLDNTPVTTKVPVLVTSGGVLALNTCCPVPGATVVRGGNIAGSGTTDANGFVCIYASQTNCTSPGAGSLDIFPPTGWGLTSYSESGSDICECASDCAYDPESCGIILGPEEGRPGHWAACGGRYLPATLNYSDGDGSCTLVFGGDGSAIGYAGCFGIGGSPWYFGTYTFESDDKGKCEDCPFMIDDEGLIVPPQRMRIRDSSGGATTRAFIWARVEGTCEGAEVVVLKCRIFECVSSICNFDFSTREWVTWPDVPPPIAPDVDCIPFTLGFLAASVTTTMCNSSTFNCSGNYGTYANELQGSCYAPIMTRSGGAWSIEGLI